MSIDVERALRASLDEHARHAPDGADLAERIIAEAALPPNVSSLRQARSWHSWGLPLLAAVVVAAVVGIGVGVSQWQLGASKDVRSGHSLVAPAPTVRGSASTVTQPAPSPRSSVSSTLPVPPPPGTNPVGVAGFRVRDLTFVGPNAGFAIGTARCTSGPGRCSAFVYTTDGTHWNNLPNTTPFNVPGVSTGCASKCVEHVRFANTHTGYVYGPSYLAMTTDGGAHWTPQPGGALALETLDNNVIRVVQHGSGCPGPCNISVETSGVGSASWASEQLPGTVLGDAAQLARTGSDAYILITKNPASGAGNQQSVLYASRDDGLHWAKAGEPCTIGRTGKAGAAETDSTAVAAGPSAVSVICQPRVSGTPAFAAVSLDHGLHFARAGQTFPFGADNNLAGDPDTVLVASGDGAYRSADGGRTWSHIADLGNATISFLGFENKHDGRAVTNGGRTIYTTRDGGRTWTPYTFR